MNWNSGIQSLEYRDPIIEGSRCVALFWCSSRGFAYNKTWVRGDAGGAEFRRGISHHSNRCFGFAFGHRDGDWTNPHGVWLEHTYTPSRPKFSSHVLRYKHRPTHNRVCRIWLSGYKVQAHLYPHTTESQKKNSAMLGFFWIFGGTAIIFALIIALGYLLADKGWTETDMRYLSPLPYY